MLFLVSMLFCLVLSVFIMVVGGLVSSKMEVEKEKGSSYECGFDSNVWARVPFSLQFFMIGVIFLIFDVEIALMLPVPLMVGLGYSEGVLFFLFVLLLLLGLFFEWWSGALEWQE